MSNDDWRLEAVAELAEALPPAYHGGPSFEKGSKVCMSFTIQTTNGEQIGFAAPNAVAMTLNLAINAAQSASAARCDLQFRNAPSPDGVCKVVPLEGSAAAFSMFEQSLSSITFSFLALEAFCNYEISRNWKQPVTVKGRKRRVETMSHTDAERTLSTEVKIREVMPKIFGVSTPAGKLIWERFLRLKKARDDSVHFKYADQYPVGPKAETEGLFFQVLDNDPHVFPEIAKDVIEYFYQNQSRPQWLDKMPPIRKV